MAFQASGLRAFVGADGLLLLGLGLLLRLLLGLFLLAPVFFLLAFLSLFVRACPAHSTNRGAFIFLPSDNIGHCRTAHGAAQNSAPAAS